MGMGAVRKCVAVRGGDGQSMDIELWLPKKGDGRWVVRGRALTAFAWAVSSFVGVVGGCKGMAV